MARNKGLIIAGSVVFGSAWLLTIATTAVLSSVTDSNRTGKNIGYSAIPIAGPLIFLGDPDNDTAGFAAPLIVSAVVQAGGVAMFILGMTLKHEVPISDAAVGGSGHESAMLTTGPVAVGSGFGWAVRLAEWGPTRW